ncbi:FABP1 protein, partial [Polypterus senegalus]
GLPDEMIEKGKEAKSISEIVQNGNSFKVTVTTGTKVLVNEFTIGEEAELQTPTGEKIKGVVTKEGENKLKVNLKGIESVTELCGDKIINCLQHHSPKCPGLTVTVPLSRPPPVLSPALSSSTRHPLLTGGRRPLKWEPGWAPAASRQSVLATPQCGRSAGATEAVRVSPAVFPPALPGVAEVLGSRVPQAPGRRLAVATGPYRVGLPSPQYNQGDRPLAVWRRHKPSFGPARPGDHTGYSGIGALPGGGHGSLQGWASKPCTRGPQHNQDGRPLAVPAGDHNRLLK